MINFSSFSSSIKRSMEINQWPLYVSGTTSPLFLAYYLSQKDIPHPRSTLVVLPSDKQAQVFLEDLKSFSTNAIAHYLPAFDESPYSGLPSSAKIISQRCNFFWRAAMAKPQDLFVCSIESLLQKTLPKDHFSSFITTLSVGEEIPQDALFSQLSQCGYEPAPLVEDTGTFSKRGDILDIFSPNYESPIRIEFFGDQIEAIKFFDITSQLSTEQIQSVVLIPCREVFASDQNLETALNKIKLYCDENGIKKNLRDNFLAPLRQKIIPREFDYWFFSFFEKTQSILDYFKATPTLFLCDELEITRTADVLRSNTIADHKSLISSGTLAPPPADLYSDFDSCLSGTSFKIYFNDINLQSDKPLEPSQQIQTTVFDTSDFVTVVRATKEAKKDFMKTAVEKILEWMDSGHTCFIFSGTQTQAQRLDYLFKNHSLSCSLVDTSTDWADLAGAAVYIIPRHLSASKRFETEKVVFLRDEDIFGLKQSRESRKTKGTLEQRTSKLSFGDLNPGDLIVHTLHGVGIYEGLKKMPINGAETEFIQLKYKDNDRLYLPVYRISQIQKYSSPSSFASVDKLGSTAWQKVKVKVRNDLKEIAAELLSLYAKRQAAVGFSFSPPDDEFREFEATFPYDETPDQLKAIDDVLSDMQKSKPMDRLVCGDVGFGKTEVAIRAAFKAVMDKKQVAILVPTTILAFQHFQTFSKRFKNTAINIAMLSRFSKAADAKKIIQNLKSGNVDIVVGTHRLLSKDIEFKDLGLLIVDEEQKFGVTHKEKIKKLRASIDVLSLSATPIPRTLNMALMGIRDLSIINTPPDDRLSIRTFINRYNDETIRKAILNEIHRGGQVYFIHNRVQSIYEFAEKIKKVVPEARIKIAHGQMADEDLENTMLEFYKHDFDVLLCTTIIESGLDIPRANTLIVDRADTFGLAQLYQLRGRVGRSKERAYAYLLIPNEGLLDKVAAERLKILHEHTELGAGFQIAHHDLELRGSGNILGDDQSGHIAAVGYELYMELLDSALKQSKGEPAKEELEPDINLRIPAFIPDTYIEDIRVRLGYYKLLTEINDESDLDQIENELSDRFGKIPEQVSNLFGLMLIRKLCKDLGVKDISSGPKNLSLSFTNQTTVKPEVVVRLTQQENKKYQLTPDQKLIIRFTSDKWLPILEELRYLKNLVF